MTFEPERIENDILVGTSALLGSCNVPIKNIDLLLLGNSVDEQARELNANPWTLALAKQPRVYEEAEAEQREGGAGTTSALVGKPARNWRVRRSMARVSDWRICMAKSSS